MKQGPTRCNGIMQISPHETDLDYITAIATAALISLFAVFSSVANGLVLIVFIRKKMLKSPLYFLLANMCAVDFFVGIVGQPVFVVIRIFELRNIDSCLLRELSSFLGYLCGGVSTCILGLISLDRLAAVIRPFRYEVVATRQRFAVLIALVYALCTLLTLLYSLDIVPVKEYYLFVSFLLFAIMLLVLLCYAKIYKAARGHERKIYSFQSAMLVAAFSREQSDQQSSINRNRRSVFKGRRQNTFAQKHKSKTVVFMAACLVMCYLPKVCVILDARLFRENAAPSYAAIKWSETAFLLNSAINPFVYCLRMTYIRQEVLKVFQSLMRRCCYR